MTHVTIVTSLKALLTRDFIWTDEVACSAAAAQLAHALSGGLHAGGSVFIELHGTLGAGKTTFTRHFLRSLGIQGRIKSPSYAVVEQHDLPGLVIQHFDFYRFNDPQEWEDAGFRDLFAAPGLKLAEWPEKAAGLLPQADLHIHIHPQDDDTRRVSVHAYSLVGQDALATLPTLQTVAAASLEVPSHG